MKKKNLKSLTLRKQSVSNLNKTFGGNASIDVSDVINTIIDFTEKYTRVFSYCPHVTCGCPDPTIPPLTEGILTCRATACEELTCVTCA
ncbi:hypothetical protein KORDIASMS9_00043 [Kordia sp. SMS9]|uniref:hypothetical protein n=1 Tax=Kordia sp. SMS9 TaxID=2282170 RepID=UPI000E0CC225|nr:hypothetical protein [Kordia sp. SMS9]AXG67861.1 hypothetical protein KORDIASMS9_00043 [Kordia sp. SMS9]